MKREARSLVGGRLSGKKAIVTGAGRGIGRRIAQMFAEASADVLAVDIDAAALDTLRKEGIGIYAADLTDPNAVVRFGVAANQIFAGKVDILVNAAAIVVMGWIDQLAPADWNKTLRGEIDTVFLVTQAVWPYLKASGRASIINFGSANAHVALDGLPAIAHAAGKGAVTSMTRQLAMEGGPHGIRANTIAPGFTVTEETARHLDNPEVMKSVRSKLMIDRLGQSDDIGYLALYLGSDESGFVTGSDFRIDGGATAW